MQYFLAILISLISIASAAHAETTYLTAAALIDPVTGRVTANPAVLIEDGVVTAVGAQASLSAPADAKVIDLGERTILPGMIDMHVHLIGDDSVRGYKALAVSTPLAAIHGVAHARDTLMAGFTTVRNVGAGGYADIALRDAINDGVVPGPRMFVSGPPVGIIGGHCSDNNLLPAEAESYG
jgi:imidazolonepropionase-like amidohydrolase